MQHPAELAVTSPNTIDALRSTYRETISDLNALAVGFREGRANKGNTTRLQWNLARCFSAADAGADQSTLPPELRVLVVGCSMTQGFMNCGTTLPGKQCTIPCDSMAWYRVLERRLQRGLPGCRIKMFRTTSRGGRTVTTAQRYETRVRRSAAHIIITDLTVCDLRGVTSSLDESRVRAGWETLIRRVLSEERSPALVHIESWAAFSPMGACRTDKSAHRLHLPLAERYGIPVTSFMLGVCAHHPQAAPLRHWRGGCSGNASTCGGAFGADGLNEEGFECEPHPGPHTHNVFALLLSELILGEAKRMAMSSLPVLGLGGGKTQTGAAIRTARRGGQRLPLLQPVPLNLEATPTVMPASIMTELAGCHAHHGVNNALATLDFAEGSCGQPTQNAGWRCYEDRPGKRGWITEASLGEDYGPGGTLSFAVPMGSTKLTVAYLRSYDHRMGIAKIWLDEDKHAAIFLNGSWDSRTSQTDIRSERVQNLCKESCLAKRSLGKHRRGTAAQAKAPPLHKIHVQRVAGRKFKLLLLEVC